MRFEIEPGFVHTRTEPRYFVLCLDESDNGYSEGFRYEVQLLNDGGEGGGVFQFSDADSEISVPGFEIPSEVVEAARRQQRGSGTYVDSRGESIRPF
jgi:hypothetical protein